MGSLIQTPSTQTAVVTTAEGRHQVAHGRRVPSCGPRSVLVRIKAVALNATDHKMPARVKREGLTSGCDFAGEVVAVGEQANDEPRRCELPRSWAPGDRVFGVVYGSNPGQPEWGAFAEYVEADPIMLCHVPDGWDWETAASVGGSVHGSVALCLFGDGNLALDYSNLKAQADSSSADAVTNQSPKPESFTKEELRKVVLVYGGSTACGTMALQLLRLAGYTPITTCSPRNFGLVESYGAVAAFDYHSETCATEMKTYTRSSLVAALDCLGNTQSAALCYAALGRAGGRYVALEKYPDSVSATRKLVKPSWVMGPVMFGRELQLADGYSQPADLAARAFACDWYPLAERLVHQERLRAHPVTIAGPSPPVGDKWADAILCGLQELRDGSVSASKLVVPVAA
uniref:Trans-enoyl reductase ucsL n=1 Tax=Acremonium sp. TaxID=2046025 RepID=UCSL_ACRSP|nr:RecName: Full=Trans-enoyl reductase ucsL; AltName: Full=UCS1025A pyrrolizidinone biosynthesis cluster protein L [Acremonium sp.]QBC88156.1 UcsL [Acremonium sp.]